ncbi:MAG: hypothetical protein WCT04_22805 [Planctomycetota bacterium]
MRNDSATTVWGRAIWMGVLALILMGAAVGSEGRIVVSFDNIILLQNHSQLARIPIRVDVQGVAPQVCTGLNIRWQSLTPHNVCNTISEYDVILAQTISTPFSRDIDVQIPKKHNLLRLQISPRFESDKTKFASDFMNITIEHKHDQLLYLIASVMGCVALLAVIIVWKFRGRVRLHLSTCVAMLVATGILLTNNTSESYGDKLIFNGTDAIAVLFGSPGWPLPLFDSHSPFHANINKSALAIDTGVFVGVLICVAVVSEYLIRRKTKSAKR